MTGGDASFSATRGVKFVDGKVFPAFTILNGSEGPGAAPVVRAVVGGPQRGGRAALNSLSGEAVLLLHGAWMNHWVMAYLAHALRREGFAAQALTYRTMRGTLEEH